MFSVNKRRAAEQIKAAFPYIETVEVSSSSFDTIRIRVKETEPIGAIYAGGRWVVVGEDGRGLEALPVESERPSRYLYIGGPTRWPRSSARSCWMSAASPSSTSCARRL